MSNSSFPKPASRRSSRQNNEDSTYTPDESRRTQKNDRDRGADAPNRPARPKNDRGDDRPQRASRPGSDRGRSDDRPGRPSRPGGDRSRGDDRGRGEDRPQRPTRFGGDQQRSEDHPQRAPRSGGEYQRGEDRPQRSSRPAGEDRGRGQFRREHSEGGRSGEGRTERAPRPARRDGRDGDQGGSERGSRFPRRDDGERGKRFATRDAEQRDRSFGRTADFVESRPGDTRHDENRPHDSKHDDAETSLLPGLKPVLELLEQSPERVDCVYLRKGRHSKDMAQILDLCRGAGIRFSLMDTDAFARVYTGKSQGVVARLFATGFVELETLLESVMDAPLPLIVFLDQVQDPGNAGTLARTLYAMGGAGMVVPRHNGVYLGAAASKAAAGALERLPVAKAANLSQALDAAAKMGFTIYGAASLPKNETPPASETAPETPASRATQDDGGPVQDIFSVTPRLPAILVLGGEEGGLRPGVRKRCDAVLGIPMLRDFDSLNVAQAGAIIISWFSRYAPTKSK